MKNKRIKHLTHWSWTYEMFKQCVGLMHRIFYKKIVIEGKKNVPDSGPLIFAPNHQNALMDPMAVSFSTKRQIVYLARADIFKIPFLPAIFNWLKILPIYRIRDGIENLKNNDQSFDVSIKILESGMSIGLFPEAAHSNKRRLLGFKKGIPRIAFQAEEQNDFKLGVKIVPVGIYYSKYNKSRSIIHIRFGKPIEVSDYIELYKENKNKAMLSLRDDMMAATSPLVIDIRNLEFYDLYESVRSMYVKNMVKRLKLGKLSAKNRFIADKMTIKLLDKYSETNPEEMENIQKKNAEYFKLRDEHNLSDLSISKKKINVFRLVWNAFLLLVFSPVFIYGFVNSSIVYILPQILVMKFKDKQFHSSVKFAWGILVLPLIYIIQFIVFWVITDNLIWSLIYIVSVPIFGILAKLYSEWFMLIRYDLFLHKLRTTNREVYDRVKTLHCDIIKSIDKISE
jgi:1-acyl-sn-glycerol-3-phosphate acyltransferase